MEPQKEQHDFSQPPQPQPVTPPAPVPPAQPMADDTPMPSFSAPAQTPFAASPQPPVAPAPAQFPAGPPPPAPSPYAAPAHHAGNQPDKKMLVIVGAVIVAVALAVGAYFLFFSKDNPISSVVGNLTGNSEVVDRSDGKLDLSNLIDPQDIIKEQDIKAKVNQQVNLSDGLSYMVTGVERNFVSTSRFLKAGTGKELVKVNFVIGNRDKTGETYISSGDFNIKNSAGGMQDAKYTTTDDFADSLEPQELASGKQIKGSLIYEVDKGEQISVVTEQKYEKLGGDKKEVTLKSQVTL